MILSSFPIFTYNLLRKQLLYYNIPIKSGHTASFCRFIYLKRAVDCLLDMLNMDLILSIFKGLKVAILVTYAGFGDDSKLLCKNTKGEEENNKFLCTIPGHWSLQCCCELFVHLTVC
jgi:hypothetical protein